METQKEDAIITNVTEAYDYVFKKLSIGNLKKSSELSIELGIRKYVLAYGIFLGLSVIIFACAVKFGGMPWWYGVALMILFICLVAIGIYMNHNILSTTKIDHISIYDFRREQLRQKLKTSFAHGFYCNKKREEWIEQCVEIYARKLISTSLFYAIVGVILMPLGNLLAIIPYPFLRWYVIVVAIVTLIIILPKCEVLIEEYNLRSKYYKQLRDMLRELPEDKLFKSPTEKSE